MECKKSYSKTNINTGIQIKSGNLLLLFLYEREVNYRLVEFQYSNEDKLKESKNKVKQESEEEIIKLIGNKILDIERKWLNAKEQYTYIKYNNESKDLLDRILTALYYQAENQKKLNRNFEIRFKKQLSKQARKELALNKRNSSYWNWEDAIRIKG